MRPTEERAAKHPESLIGAISTGENVQKIQLRLGFLLPRSQRKRTLPTPRKETYASLPPAYCKDSFFMISNI